jgi:hypothetical protein
MASWEVNSLMGLTGVILFTVGFVLVSVKTKLGVWLCEK